MTRITFLGTGTSHGIPVIGCTCPVCQSEDPRDKRYRSSILVEKDGSSVIIDTGYEFRLQCVRAGVMHIDGILYTHAHSDRLMGLDDLRVFSCKKPIAIYSFPDVLEAIKRIFPYAFLDCSKKGLPHLEAVTVEPYKPFNVGNLTFQPIPVMHGRLRIAGYRFGNAAYITDVSDMLLEDNIKYLDGVDTLIIGALREMPHETHFSFSEALENAEKIGAKHIYFTHICHSTSNKEINSRYSGRAQAAYDGLVLEV